MQLIQKICINNPQKKITNLKKYGIHTNYKSIIYTKKKTRNISMIKMGNQEREIKDPAHEVASQAMRGSLPVFLEEKSRGTRGACCPQRTTHACCPYSSRPSSVTDGSDFISMDSRDLLGWDKIWAVRYRARMARMGTTETPNSVPWYWVCPFGFAMK